MKVGKKKKGLVAGVERAASWCVLLRQRGAGGLGPCSPSASTKMELVVVAPSRHPRNNNKVNNSM